MSNPTIAQKYAAQIMAGADNQLTPEQSRHLFLACTALAASARDAEHFAFMAMAECEKNTQALDVAEFINTTKARLVEVRDQLKFISGLFNEKKFKG